MPKDEIIESFAAVSTTRRTIVTTGTKLAYAAPIVAATFKLGTRAADAVSANGPCTTFVCGAGPCVVTGTIFNCFCFENVATPGQGTCLGDFPCGGPTCSSDADCNGGTCVTNTCCGLGVQVCAPPCPEAGTQDLPAPGTKTASGKTF
jgi:hypothetical protein